MKWLRILCSFGDRTLQRKNRTGILSSCDLLSVECVDLKWLIFLFVSFDFAKCLFIYVLLTSFFSSVLPTLPSTTCA